MADWRARLRSWLAPKPAAGEGEGREDGSPPALPPGRTIYAIGDIHGCRSQLAALHRLIAQHAASQAAEHVCLVYLGDYIDRGPDSAGVIDDLLQAPPVPGAERVFLSGNHEAAMLAALARPESGAAWLEFGGLETAASYGVRLPPGPSWREGLLRTLNETLPLVHRRFLQDLALSWQAGDYVFAHAGLRPGVPLPEQNPEDLLWIRAPFLDDPRPCAGLPGVACVVHGHTPVAQVAFHPGRIAVDTGAYFSGTLSCVVLTGAERDILSVSG